MHFLTHLLVSTGTYIGKEEDPVLNLQVWFVSILIRNKIQFHAKTVFYLVTVKHFYMSDNIRHCATDKYLIFRRFMATSKYKLVLRAFEELPSFCHFLLTLFSKAYFLHTHKNKTSKAIYLEVVLKINIWR